MQDNEEKHNKAYLSELVHRMGGGDRSALLEFYDATGALAYGLILEVIKDPPTAEEVLIEAYTDAWREATLYRSEEIDPVQWLSVIVRTCALIRFYAMHPIHLDEGARATPPFFIRDLIATRIEHEGDLARSLESSRELIEAALATSETPARNRVNRRKHKLGWAVGAMLALAGILLFVALQQVRVENARLAARADQDREEVGKLQAALDGEKGRTRELAAMDEALQSPGLRIVPLESQQPETPCSGALFWDTEKERIVAAGYLPPLSPGMTYQLWFVTGGGKRSGGLLDTDESGHTFTVLDAGINIEEVDMAGVTLEPEGGSQEPTTRFKLLGSLK